MSRTQDEEHLNLLSIFHYVLAGIAGLFACFPLIHFTMGLVMIFFGAAGAEEGSGPDVFPAIIGVFFVVFAGTFILLGWSLAVCVLLAGLNLSRRRHYMFCLVMAGISCAFMPLGTVLGVFTIVVLMRPSVKALFAEKKAPASV